MKIERILVQACCGKTATIFKIDRPITTQLLTALADKGFTERPNFTKAGLLYMDNLDFTLTGSIGTDRLHINCKQKECVQKLNELEALFLQME
jgi:hypothetical protein